MASILSQLYTPDVLQSAGTTNLGFRSTAQYQAIAQSWQPRFTDILKGFDVKFAANTGSPVGNVWFEIRDIGSNPENGALLATSSTIAVATIIADIYSIQFNLVNKFIAGATYYLLVRGDFAVSASNYVNIVCSNASSYAGGLIWSWNGSVWSSALPGATYDLVFTTYNANPGKWSICQVNGNNTNDGKGWKKAAFTSGGTYVPQIGEVITGATSGRTATIQELIVTSGTFAGGDAAGSLYIFDNASGAFTGGENIDIGANLNVLTLTADLVYSCLKDVTGCTTAKGVVGGDKQELAKSPDPYDTGVNITVTNQSANMTLSAPLTMNVHKCQSTTGWTPVGTGVSVATNNTLYKYGTVGIIIRHPTSPALGKDSYYTFGAAQDFSGYTKLTFYMSNIGWVFAAGGQITFRLCSDSTGDVVVDEFIIPVTQLLAVSGTCACAFTVARTGGGALGSNINSFSTYIDVAYTTQNTAGIQFNYIAACNAFSFTSLIKIGAPRTKWLPSTSKSQNDEIVCNYAYENGDSFLYYKNVNPAGGTTGTTQPIWPVAIGEQITDGTVIWECMGEDEAWWPIQSIDGTALRVDVGTSTLPTFAQQGYYGRPNGTYALWARETTKLTPVAAAATSIFTVVHANRAVDDLSVRGRTYGGVNPATGIVDGETYYDSQNGLGVGYVDSTTVGYRDTVENLAFVRTGIGFQTGTASFRQKFQLLDAVSVGSYCINATGVGVRGMEYLGIRGCGIGFTFYGKVGFGSKAKGFISFNPSSGGHYFSEILYPDYIKGVYSRNSYAYGMYITTGPSDGMVTDMYVSNVRANSGGITMNTSPNSTINLKRALLSDSLEFVGYSTSLSDNAVYSEDHDQITDNHQIFWNGGKAQYIYDGSFKHGSATGSWRLNPLNVIRNSGYPLRLMHKYFLVRCLAYKQVTIKVWYYKNHANINGKIYVAANQLKGMPETVVSSITSTVGSWQYLTASFTPTETGVAYWQFHCWDGVTTDKNLYISDFSQTFG